MDAQTWASVDAYLEHLFPDDEVLTEVNAEAARAGLPAIQVSALHGRLLELLVRIHGARRALEFGTLAGYSTIHLARGLTGDRPHVITLELNPRHAAVARVNVERAGLAEVVEIRVGDAAQSAAALTGEGVEPFDVVFIDADKPSNVRYLELALQMVRSGAVIVVDNVVRGGAVADPGATDASVVGTQAVLARVARDHRLSATVVQTVGSKGYDGFMLIRVGP